MTHPGEVTQHSEQATVGAYVTFNQLNLDSSDRVMQRARCVPQSLSVFMAPGIMSALALNFHVLGVFELMNEGIN